MTSPIRVILAGNSSASVAEAQKILSASEQISVTRVVLDPEPLAILEQNPEVLVLFSDDQSEHFLALLASLPGGTPIVCVYDRTDPEIIIRAAAAGVTGHVCLPSIRSRIEEAVLRVAGGEAFLDSESASVLLSHLHTPAHTDSSHTRDLFALLTARERQVFMLLAQGLSAAEIGKRLFVSQKTVETHRAHILKKLDLNSTAELARFALALSADGYTTKG